MKLVRHTPALRRSLSALALCALAACSSASPALSVPPGEALGERRWEVVALMEARRAQDYAAGSRSDGNHLCLVAQGGGMRGVVAAASAVALDQLGFGEVFDSMYGTSAGGLTVAYLAAGQIAYGTSIYYQNLAGNSYFLDPWRISEPMDLDFLFDQWITRGKPLDLDAIDRTPVRVAVATTEISTGQTRILDNRELSGDDFIAALRASASMPLFSGNRERIGEREYSDGFVAASLPIENAVADGCTHMVVLPTTIPEARDDIGLIERIYTAIRLADYPAPFVFAFRQRGSFYNGTVDRLYGPGYGLPTLVIAPRDPRVVPDSGETAPRPLIAAAAAALRRVERIFGAAANSTRLYFAPEGLIAFPSPAAATPAGKSGDLGAGHPRRSQHQ